jgi:hypothetical protein
MTSESLSEVKKLSAITTGSMNALPLTLILSKEVIE